MKRLTILAAALALTACGDNSQSSAGNEAPSKPAAETKTAAAAPAEAAPAAEKTPEERGKIAFRECATCHTVKKDGGNMVGPNLFGVYGREAGKVEDFAYTDAMKESGLVWDEPTLNAYLENPMVYVRGTRMAYPGQKNAEKRADIIAYLKSLK